MSLSTDVEKSHTYVQTDQTPGDKHIRMPLSTLCDQEMAPSDFEVNDRTTRWHYHYTDSSLNPSLVIQSGNGLLCVLFKWCTRSILYF